MKPLPSSTSTERSYGDEANTVKLIIYVELLKANYNELKDNISLRARSIP